MGNQPTPADVNLDQRPAYLGMEPPAWGARGLAWILTLLFVAAVVGATIIRAPETVSCSFTLVPTGGTDPVRAPCEGFVMEVRAKETQTVSAGETLFQVRSDTTAERSNELEALQLQSAGAQKGLANIQERQASLQRADENEMRRLEGRAKALDRKIAGSKKVSGSQDESEREAIDIAKKEVESLTNELEYRRKVQSVAAHAAQQGRLLIQSHALSDLENLRIQLEADRAWLDVHQTERELAAAKLRLGQQETQHQGHAIERELSMDQLAEDHFDNESALEKLRHQRHAADRDFAEQERALRESIAKSNLRISVLKRQLDRSRDNQVAIAAPCAGAVLRLRVKAIGAFVRTGDVLCELAASGDRLEAELAVPPTGAGRIRIDQGVKLYYDAFPYQRHGVKYAKVHWISPAGNSQAESQGFRALADFDDGAFTVDGREHAVRAGMGGRAEIVVGKRPLISYAFEPLRQLRESLSDQPEAAGHSQWTR